MTSSEPSANQSHPAPPEGAIHGPEALAAAISRLFRSARREARLFAPHLGPSVFSTAAVIDAITFFITRHPRNRVRVLVEDQSQLSRDNGRLIELARRLADGIELRQVEDNDRGARDLFLVVDRSAYMVQEDVGRNDAVVNAHAKHEAVKLIERFDAAWERGGSIALRTLGL